MLKILTLGFCLFILALSFMIHEWLIGIFSCLLGFAMLAITISDAKRFIVPDIITLPIMPVGLFATGLLSEQDFAHNKVLEHFISLCLGVVLFYGIKWAYRRLKGYEGMGLGDVKLAGVAGAWTGLAGLNYVILLACAMAFTVLLLSNFLFGKKLKTTTAVPFGAFLAPSIWIVWSLQMQIVM